MNLQPESLAEAHETIYRLMGELHRQEQRLVRLKRTNEILKRVPADVAERVGPELIVAMAEREGEKAACEEAARQERDLPRLVEEMTRRAAARQREAVGDQGSAAR